MRTMMSTVDTQQRILDSARELIFSRSYADVGVAAICEHAGVKKGSFYYFYPSKQALALAVLDIQFTDFKEKLINRVFADDAPPLARLANFVEAVYEIQNKICVDSGQVWGCPFGNLSTELSTRDEAIRKRTQQIFVEMQRLICRVVEAAQEVGELSPEVDGQNTAQAMVAYFEGVLLLAKNQNNPELIHRLLPFMAQIRINRA